MFYVGQRVVCDRMGIHCKWTDHESGRVETDTYYDVENDVGRFPQRGDIANASVDGFPQRGGIYTVAGIAPGKVTLKEIPYLYVEGDRWTDEPKQWDQNLFRPFNNSSKRDLKWFEVLERVREIERNIERVSGPTAEIYAVAFKKFLDVAWGTSEDDDRSWSWTAQDVFDAVNVVLCQA